MQKQVYLHKRIIVSVFWFTLHLWSNSITMPKRKLVKETTVDSELSPPPNGLLENGDAQAPASKKRKTKKVKKDFLEADGEADEVVETEKPAEKKGGKQNVKTEDEEPSHETNVTSKKGKKHKQVPKKAQTDETEANGKVGEKKAKVKRHRKSKEQREAEAMPVAARTVGHKLFIGAHVSSAGGQSCFTHSLYSCGTNTESSNRRAQLHRQQRPHWC